jgi:WD40 repeat protein
MALKQVMNEIAIDPTKTRLITERAHDRPLTACRYDPTGRFVFFGAEDNLVHRYEIETKAVAHLNLHDSWVRAIGLSPSGDVLYSGGYDGRLAWWPAAEEKPEPIRVVDAHEGWLRALAVSPDGGCIATCGNDNLVKLWDAADGALLSQFAGHESHVYNVAFDPGGASLVSCDLKGNLKQWDVTAGVLKRDLPAASALYIYDKSFRADIGGARSIAFRPDGQQLALGGITNVSNAFAGVGNIAVVLVDLPDKTEGAEGEQAAEPKIALQLEAEQKVNGTAWGIAWHPDRFWIGLAGGGGGGWFYFWKGDAQHEFFKLKLKTDGRDMALSPDATHVAVAHADKNLRLYALFEKVG